MSAPARQQLEDVLRQIVELKRSGASGAAVDTLVEEAWDLWAEIQDKPRAWHPDVAAIARELGFATQTITTEELAPVDLEAVETASKPAPPPLDPARMERAVRLMKLAKEIDQAIIAQGGVGNVQVACSANLIVLSGIAADEDARDQALIIAAKLAPGVEIKDSIVVA